MELRVVLGGPGSTERLRASGRGWTGYRPKPFPARSAASFPVRNAMGTPPGL